MTTDPDSASRRQAGQDLADIGTLRQTEAFGRYFLARLRRKQADLETKFRNDPPDKCPPGEREILRRIIAEYDEVLGFMARDEATAKALMERQ